MKFLTVTNRWEPKISTINPRGARCTCNKIFHHKRSLHFLGLQPPLEARNLEESRQMSDSSIDLECTRRDLQQGVKVENLLRNFFGRSARYPFVS
jgi:hypothetical protein